MPLFRRVVIAVLIGAALLVIWRWRQPPPQQPGTAARPETKTVAVAAAVPAISAPASGKAAVTAHSPAASAPPEPVSDLDRIKTADPLNAPEGTIQHDLEILVTLFEDWRSFFPGEGNPWGDNAEIAARLMGQNKRKLVFIAEKHRAINASGELCDRWGTPFRFHALAAERMEIRSAGPDKVFGTSDDVNWTPP